MHRLLTRRSLAFAAGAFAGIAVAGRQMSIAAQDEPTDEETGAIDGVVTDTDSGAPLADVYVVVGWRNVQRAGVTDEEGRYTVEDVPAGEAVDVLGFRAGGYRYHNSAFDADIEFTLDPGETATYDFGLTPLPEEGQPEVTDPVIDPQQASAGEEVTFAVTARGGAGGLSPEVIAANGELGRMVLMEQGDSDRWQTTWAIPDDAEPGDYPFAFFAASKECFVNGEFPMVTLTIGGNAGTRPATPSADASAATPGADGEEDDAQTEVTVEMVDIDFNPNEFSIPANTDVTVRLPNNGAVVHNFHIDPLDVHSEDVNPGDETTVTINAEPGDYEYYCSIPGHRQAGMVGTVHVE